MKILLVISSLRGGGAERVMSEMANFWAASGREVTLATTKAPVQDDVYPLDARVRRVVLGSGDFPGLRIHTAAWLMRVVRRLRRLIRSTRPGVVVSFMDITNVLTIAATRRLGIRVVVSERIDPSANTELPRHWRWFRRIGYPLADDVVVQTAAAARWFSSEYGIPVTVIPNPLRVLPDTDGPREQLVLSIGRLAHQKGFDILLRAFASVRARFPAWRLVILGEGPLRDELERLREALELSAVVEMPGRVADIEWWFARAGLVVQASRFEGFPNALLEAMGMGAPVISTACPSGPSELICDGLNGRLVPVDDVISLAAVMAELMADPDKREEMGRAAMEVRSRFSQHAVMAMWDKTLFLTSGAGTE